MRILCTNCGNTTNFTLIRTVELVFDPKKGEWDKAQPIEGRGIIYCRDCDNDQDSVEITVEE